MNLRKHIVPELPNPIFSDQKEMNKECAQYKQKVNDILGSV